MKWRVSVGLRPGIVVESISQRYFPAIPISIRSVASPIMGGPPGLLKFCFPVQLPFMKERVFNGSEDCGACCWLRHIAPAQTTRMKANNFIELSCCIDDIKPERQATRLARSLAQYTAKNRVHIAQLSRVIEGARQLLRAQ